jgi:ABC-type branched-subunit amino acid transport system ATPase component
MATLERLETETASLALVFVEQHVNVALKFCEKAVVLDRGRIAYMGTSADLLISEILEQTLGLNIVAN